MAIRFVRRCLGICAVTGFLGAAMTGVEGRELLWQTNAEGDDVHVFDVETGALVRRLVVGANPHGIAATSEGETVYLSLERNGEARGELIWVNRRTFEIEHRLEVGPEPHAIAVTPDGRWVYVPCRDGHYWVIDGTRREIVARIETGGRPHNTMVAPDGSHVFLSPMGSPERVSIVDPDVGHRVVGTISFSSSVRPPAIAFSRNLFFQHVDGLNGFEVADLDTRTVIARVEHSAGLGIPVWPARLGFLGLSGLSRCHGLAVRPGDREIWSICGTNATVHALADRTFPEEAHLDLPGKGYWLTFSADGRYVFVALSAESQVAMIDAETREIVRILDAGAGPKRNLILAE